LRHYYSADSHSAAAVAAASVAAAASSAPDRPHAAGNSRPFFSLGVAAATLLDVGGTQKTVQVHEPTLACNERRSICRNRSPRKCVVPFELYSSYSGISETGVGKSERIRAIRVTIDG
jgi:hypothetical protein